MAKESNGQENESSGGKRLLPLGIAIALGLLVGGGAGAFVAGPLLAARSEAPVEKAAEEDHAPEAEEEDHAEEEGGEDHGEGEGTAGAQALYVMDNLVLNPARSGGTRFLMVTMAFDLKSETLVEEMKTRDAEVRDVVLSVLGAKTVMELSDVAARDSLKMELKSNVSTLFHEGAVRQIYFPQFVIQ